MKSNFLASLLPLKMVLLFKFIAAAIAVWHREVYCMELNDHYCCDNSKCFCKAATVAETFTHQKTNITFFPVVLTIK